ncbi:MAG: M6 family metalloprotease domain-containing protein [Campylobacterota bacterium]|nr:M6 family metalloprotease domain-containing protein [Campylobacterota bacterium]
MIKYIFLSLIFLFFTACSSSTSTTTDSNSISIIPSDTIPNPDVAQVPHKKSSIAMLGILISYNNIKISSNSSAWSSKLFGKNEHELNHYFIEVSNSKFEFIKANETNGVVDDGIVSATLNKNHPDSDINIDSSQFSSQVYPDLKAALEAVDNQINFSNYDADANGHITPDELLFTFIIAGYEDAYEGWHIENGIWAHQSCTSPSQTPTLDGVTLMGCNDKGNFALFGEQHNKSKPHNATIGIIAHELGHSAFRLPDLYNTASDYGGIGYFGLMGGGLWAKKSFNEEAGNTPVHLSAWSKVYANWVTPTQESGSTSLHETSTSNYNIIKIPISANNHYLLENRNNSGYDRGLYALSGSFNGGMAIWHINENQLTTAKFESNSVNAETDNKGVDLVEAANATIDDNAQASGDEKALFYYLNVSEFGTEVTNISIRGSTMTLNIN